MPSVAKKPRNVIRDIEIFDAGDWKGENYSLSDLDDAVRNFRALSFGDNPKIRPPFVAGHEEDGHPFLNTGYPAFGYLVGLRRKGTKLFGDVSNVFPKIARLIKAGAYSKVSVEFAAPDEPPEGVDAHGLIVKRLGFLGGSLPHIKSLADIPEPEVEFSEPSPEWTAPRVHLTAAHRSWQTEPRTGRRTVEYFSEVRIMAEDAIQQVAEAAVVATFPGLPEEFVKSLTPDQFAMLAPAVGGEETGEGKTPPDGSQTSMAEWPAGMDRAAIIAALVGMGEDQAALDAMSDDDLIAAYNAKMGNATAMSETETEEEQTVTTPAVQPTKPKKVTTQTTQTFSEADVEAIVNKAVAKVIAPFKRDVESERNVRRAREKQERTKLIRSFCDELVEKGQCSRAQVEFAKDGKPIGPIAIGLVNVDATRKFADGTTALEQMMEALKKQPIRKFSEQVADPLKQQGQLTGDRREYLLGLTERGKAILEREKGQRQNARIFAETMGQVLKTAQAGN